MKKTLAKRLTARILAVALIGLLFADSQSFYIKAATFDEVNQSAVFLKQPSGSNTCTLFAAAMMVRRAAILNNDAGWAEITVDSMTPKAWSAGVGLKWDFTYSGITVTHDNFSGDANDLALRLASHPEGIVVYKQRSNQTHAVLVTDYRDGVFYCADPSPAAPIGRITMDEATIELENANYLWYVTSPDLYLTDASGNIISHENLVPGSIPKATAKPAATPKATAKPKTSAKPKTTAKPKNTAKPKTTAKPKATDKPEVTAGKVKAPKKVSSLSVKNTKKKTLTTSWSKVSGAKGYQILYGTNKTFAGCASISQSKKRCKLTRLIKGKVYYVKVRAYNLNGSRRIYGKCSAVKKAKVKK